jgi:hypothetical protein
MATNHARANDPTPQGRPSYERASGVMEIVREKIDEVATEAEWALGSDDASEREWLDDDLVEEDTSDDDDDDDDDDDGFFTELARALEESLLSNERGESWRPRLASENTVVPFAANQR